MFTEVRAEAAIETEYCEIMDLIGKREKQRGLALVVVLWISIIMTLLVTSFVKVVKTGIAKTGTEASLLLHYANLDSALEMTMFRLIDKKTTKTWLRPELVHRLRLNRSNINIKIDDPAGLIDLNFSERNILSPFIRRIIGNQGKADEITEQILSRRKIGLSKKKSYFAFRHHQELLRLPAVNGEYFKLLRNFITVHSGQKQINPSTAPREVLQSIPGISRPLTEAFLKRRKTNPEDKNIYADLITRSDGLLALSKRNFHIIYIAAPWGKTGKFIGRRYVVATGLDKDKPYRLLSWSNYVSDSGQRV